MEMENKKRWNPIPRRSALVTLVLLVAVGCRLRRRRKPT